MSSDVNALIAKRDELIRQLQELPKEIRCLQQEIQRAVKPTMVLSERQEQVLVRVRAGELNKIIADELHITERTVKFHIARLFAKFGVHDRRDL